MTQDGLQSDASSLDVLISLADLYVQNGLIEEAKGLLETAIEQNRNIAEPYFSLGKIYSEEGNREKAVLLLREAEKIDPKNQSIKELLSSIGEEEGLEKAVEEIPLKGALRRELDKILKIEGVTGVILVDEIGSPIQAELDLPLDDDSTGAIITTVYNRIDGTTKSIGLGVLKVVLFELPGGNIFVFGTVSLRLIVLARRDIHFASIEGRIREVFERTKSILEVD